MSIIRDFFREKGDWIILGTTLFLIVALSFGLGYVTAKEKNPAPIIIQKNSN